MTANITAKSGKNIRLTEERWQHIIEQHPELLGLQTEIARTIENPDKILEGINGELLAIKSISLNKYLVAIYRELSDDGFLITAYLTRRSNSLNRRKQLWP